MKQILLCTLLFAACSPKIIQPTIYQTDIVKIESSLSFDAAWSKMIDILSERGTSIKILDKSSGLMTTDDYSLINSYTFENKNGSYINPQAYVVLGKIKYNGVLTLKPENIFGSWNIRIKQDGDKVTISVNLVNLKAYRITSGQYGVHTYNFPVQSTGVFEKSIADNLK